MADTARKQASTPGARHQSSRPTGLRSGIEGTALVTLRAMTSVEMARLTKALETEGIGDVMPARIILSRADARRVASGSARAFKVTVVPGETAEAVVAEAPEQTLERSLKAARVRGEAVKDQLLADPEMLSTAQMAERLGMSEEGIRLKRKRHEVLGLEFARRGIRYPSWQLLENRQLLRDLPRLFSVLGDSPWAVYRFLLQRHPELGGARAVDAFKRGRLNGVLAAAENTASGAFS
jgi:hypothetical protein